ncbi:MAG: MBL fold metallo-hydrolase [Candidatus Marinimicrobia bacterium]|nr:MBL fold metallo-hydrolase [Candidatus Neomarinimicrobiota bacterium]
MNNEIKIIKINAGRSNVYFIKNKSSCIMVDAGFSGLNKIINIANANDINLKKIDMLILTHTHYDHVNLLHELNKIIYTEILVHNAGERFLKFGQTPVPYSRNILGKFLLLMSRIGGPSKFDPVVPDTLIDGDYNTAKFGFDLSIIPTPGHTEDSVSVIIDKKFAFVGDTIFNIFPMTIYPIFVDNREQLQLSWKRLLDLQCEYYFPGHGKKISFDRLKSDYERVFGKK